MSDSKEINYKHTVNLPTTDFPIRAGLSNKEPELLAKWSSDKLSDRIYQKLPETAPTFTLHDGPPYPNGSIHMGHAMNKILKDITVRYHQRLGKRSVYIPGWDCHGLPIETQVVKALKKKGEEAKKDDITWFRNTCQSFALDYVEEQRTEFQRLGISGRWETPYLTLTPEYEAHTLECFGKMAENGLVYKGRKPIHWCMHCNTALAEAEIEYAEHRSPSIYVTFSLVTPSDALRPHHSDKRPIHFLVWTTTPWTLPANVAIAAHPDFTYQMIEYNGAVYVVVAERSDDVIQLLEMSGYNDYGTLSGHELSGSVVSHPFLERQVPIVTASYVTKDDGTGFVHIAPGHGQDDYFVGLEHDLPVIMPVDDSGRFTDDVEWAGMNVFDANKPIGMRMESKGTLKKLTFIKHSYPHCWRCKHPVIFRATEQWFIGMDRPMSHIKGTLREQALSAVDATQWIPEWGKKRIRPMIEQRPDWCISRQRYWGIPIPVFTCKQCGHSEMTGAFNRAVVDIVKQKGSIAWFEMDANDLLPNDVVCSQCGTRDFEKESDILDVWFESGSSFSSVLTENDGVTLPADLYLEGSDQHRGWFQSSLLIGIGSHGIAPYTSVLTHGFLVDHQGRKMSKSEGNTLSPQSVISDYGADVLRWWVASSDVRSDISISKDIMNQSRDAYLKVRNTIRFCMSNLYDFSPETDMVSFNEMAEMDRWVLGTFNRLIQTVKSHYDRYEFHLAVQAIHQFCVVTLSAYYLDMTKDRLYCDAADSITRRSIQSALHEIADGLLSLLAPVLVFTCDDAYTHLPSSTKEPSIHLTHMPEYRPERDQSELVSKWDTLIDIRDRVYQYLETLRNDKIVRGFLEARVDLVLPNTINFDDWEAFLIVAKVTVTHGDSLSISVSRADGDKCARCWKVTDTVNSLCGRCSSVMSTIEH